MGAKPRYNIRSKARQDGLGGRPRGTQQMLKKKHQGRERLNSKLATLRNSSPKLQRS